MINSNHACCVERRMRFFFCYLKNLTFDLLLLLACLSLSRRVCHTGDLPQCERINKIFVVPCRTAIMSVASTINMLMR